MTKQNGFTKSVKKQHENRINLNKVGKLWANKKISNFKKTLKVLILLVTMAGSQTFKN